VKRFSVVRFYYQNFPGGTTPFFILPRNKISEAVQITAQGIFRQRLFAKTVI
jgi:hypothetical protein